MYIDQAYLAANAKKRNPADAPLVPFDHETPNMEESDRCISGHELVQQNCQSEILIPILSPENLDFCDQNMIDETAEPAVLFFFKWGQLAKLILIMINNDLT